MCNCKQWYKIQNGDDCAPVAAKFNISKDQLLKWNPWLTVDGYECAGMWPQSNVCVGTFDDAPFTSSRGVYNLAYRLSL